MGQLERHASTFDGSSRCSTAEVNISASTALFLSSVLITIKITTRAKLLNDDHVPETVLSEADGPTILFLREKNQQA